MNLTAANKRPLSDITDNCISAIRNLLLSHEMDGKAANRSANSIKQTLKSDLFVRD